MKSVGARQRVSDGDIERLASLVACLAAPYERPSCGLRMPPLDPRSRIDVSKPLAAGQARRLLNANLEEGHKLSFSEHACDELEKDDMDMMDVMNVLRCGQRIDAPEPHPNTGAWNYRVHTHKMCVVVEFVSETHVRIVTGWRREK